MAEAQRNAFSQFQRELEQAHRAAGEKFDLGLADCARAPAAADLPAIKTEFGQAAVGETQAQPCARKLGRKNRRQCRAQPWGAKQLGLRRRGEQAEVERRARQRPFPFLANVQPGRGPAFGLSVCSQCPPSERRRNASPARSKARSGVS